MTKTQSSMSKLFTIAIGLGAAFLMTAGNASADVVEFDLSPGSITNVNGGGGTKLTAGGGGTINALGYVKTTEITLTEFDGTGADIKLKSFGSDGFYEIVLNSFGNMRLFLGGTGNVQDGAPDQIATGIADTDVLNFTETYVAGTDSLTVTYAINAGAALPVYTGANPIGNRITNFSEIELFEFGAGAPVPTVSIDSWKLVNTVPEPGSFGVMASGLFLLGFVRRRR